MDGILEVAGLTKRYGKRAAVDDVDLAVPEACAYGFLGPNGAGKTTLIRCLLGLTRPTAGTIRLLGLDQPRGRRQALARTGAIVEEPRFHGHLSGRENLTTIAAARDRDAVRRVDDVLRRVGLAERATERVKRYSLGMRQRLGVARALLGDPQLLILDEPTNGLDPAGIHEFREMIRGFVENEGRTVFLSSHLLDGHAAVKSASIDSGRLHLTVEPGREAAAAINRLLVEAGLDVHQLAPAQATLEQRFLEITSRLGEDEPE